MRCLVVFYSLTAVTESVALKLGDFLHAETEPIKCETPYGGGFGYLKAAFHSLIGRDITILPPKFRPSDYDLVVVGGPIWAGRIAPPVRTYLQQYHGHFKNVAHFVTHGGSSPARAFKQMEMIGGQPPIATVAIREKHVVQEQYELAVRQFADKLRKELGQNHQHVA
jgi:flavodoxin